MQTVRDASVFFLLSLLFFCPASAQEARVAAHFTVHVVAAADARQFPHVKVMDGMPTITLGREEDGQTFELPVETYILVRFAQTAGVQGYEVSPLHGVLESPSGLVHMPMGVMGVLRAVNAGTATITVKAVPKGSPTQNANPGGTVGPNWSGYALSGGPFSFIQGQWQVPKVQEEGGSHFSSTWVGIERSKTTPAAYSPHSTTRGLSFSRRPRSPFRTRCPLEISCWR
jgi:hypothetical protein